jgi:1,4-dihydroxy-2-naphthoyl-CoA synthase
VKFPENGLRWGKAGDAFQIKEVTSICGGFGATAMWRMVGTATMQAIVGLILERRGS